MSDHGSQQSISSKKSHRSLLKKLGTPRTANEAAKNFQKMSSAPAPVELAAAVSTRPKKIIQSQQPIASLTAIISTTMDTGIGTPQVSANANDSTQVESNHINEVRPQDAVSITGSRSSIDQEIIQKLADSQAELASFSKENFKLQQRTNRTMEAMVVSQDLPSLTIEKFSGDPASFPGFSNEFDSLIKEKVKDPARRFPFLLQYCEGEALKVIRDFCVLPPMLRLRRLGIL